MQQYTEQDFDQLDEFHDVLLRGLLIRADVTRSDLVLDIDHIVKGRQIEGGDEWLIAAADLTFHGVTGLKFSTDFRDARYQVSMSGDWITSVRREVIVPQLVHFDRCYWRWEFSFSLATQLSFGAYGFTLQHRQEPMWRRESSLSLAERA